VSASTSAFAPWSLTTGAEREREREREEIERVGVCMCVCDNDVRARSRHLGVRAQNTDMCISCVCIEHTHTHTHTSQGAQAALKGRKAGTEKIKTQKLLQNSRSFEGCRGAGACCVCVCVCVCDVDGGERVNVWEREGARENTCVFVCAFFFSSFIPFR